jgi:hypothetical protein
MWPVLLDTDFAHSSRHKTISVCWRNVKFMLKEARPLLTMADLDENATLSTQHYDLPGRWHLSKPMFPQKMITWLWLWAPLLSVPDLGVFIPSQDHSLQANSKSQGQGISWAPLCPSSPTMVSFALT